MKVFYEGIITDKLHIFREMCHFQGFRLKFYSRFQAPVQNCKLGLRVAGPST